MSRPTCRSAPRTRWEDRMCLTLWPLLHLPIAISLTCLSCSVLALRLNAWPPLHTDSETVKIGYWYWRCCNHSIQLVFSPACWASPHLLWCNLVLLYEGALNLVRYCIAWTLPWTLFATSLLYAIGTYWILVLALVFPPQYWTVYSLTAPSVLIR